MKLLLTLLFICALGFTQADLNVGSNLSAQAGFSGLSLGQFFLNVILQPRADRLLNNPNLSADLRQRVEDAMANAKLGFDNCSSLILFWNQIRCADQQLKTTKNELRAIEIAARAQTAGNSVNAAASATA